VTGGIDTGIGGLVLILLGGFIYFLPTFVGQSKRNAGAIFVLNLLLGWTVVGWVVALVWAMTVDPLPAAEAIRAPSAASAFCTGCGASLPVGSRFCAKCARPVAA
jgi:hypothetical protein